VGAKLSHVSGAVSRLRIILARCENLIDHGKSQRSVSGEAEDRVDASQRKDLLGRVPGISSAETAI
jgi:hypothetical protein